MKQISNLVKLVVFPIFLSNIMLAINISAQLPITIAYNWQPPIRYSETVNNSIGFWGLATSGSATQAPRIEYNLYQMQLWNVPQEVMIFARVHEYGHLLIPSSDENTVDCWASRQLVSTDPQILQNAIYWVDNVLANYGGSPGRPNGHQRAERMRQCGMINKLTDAAINQSASGIDLHPVLPPPAEEVSTTEGIDFFQTPPKRPAYSMEDGVTLFLNASLTKFNDLKGNYLTADTDGNKLYAPTISLIPENNGYGCRIHLNADRYSSGVYECNLFFETKVEAQSFKSAVDEIINNLVASGHWEFNKDINAYEEKRSEAEKEIYSRKRLIKSYVWEKKAQLIISGPIENKTRADNNLGSKSDSFDYKPRAANSDNSGKSLKPIIDRPFE